jgi:integrase
MLEAELQICDGAIHHMVLLRTETGAEPDRSCTVPTSFRVARTCGRYDQSEARRSQAHLLRSGGLWAVSPELAAGIRRVKGVKQLGSRSGNWLNREQAQLLLEKADGEGLRSVRDVAMIAIRLGCGLRRAELASLRKEDI